MPGCSPSWFRSPRFSKDDLELFRLKHKPKNMDLVHISLTKHVPESHWPFVLDWSYSNLASLYEFGYRAGVACLTDENRKLFTDRRAGAAGVRKTSDSVTQGTHL
jgi:hypothetical protein